MVSIEYDYAPVPTIERFSRSDAAIRGLIGPFGSGKSSGCAIELIRRAQAQTPGTDGVRRSQWAVIRNTYIQLRDTTLPIFHRWIPPPYFGTYSEAMHEYRITNLPGCDILIKFRALDRPDQVANLLSSWYTGAWVNEAREVPWAVIAALQGRVGRYYPEIPSWSGIWMDTNAPDVDSWWYSLFEDRRIPFSYGDPSPDEQKLLDQCEIFHQPGGLSPGAENLVNLKPGYYQSLLMDARSKRVYIDAEYGFLSDGKPVFPEYDDQQHCKPLKYVESQPIYRGYDFGLTPACVMAQTIGGRINVFDELCSNDMGADRFGDAVLLHCGKYAGPYIDVGDPSGADPSQADEKTCFEVLQSKGINISGGGLPRQYTQSYELRLGSVRKGLLTLADGRPMMMIDPKCKMLRKGFNGAYQYRRMQVSTERYLETPDKTMVSHPHDALQAVMVHLVGEQLRGIRDYAQPKPGWNQPYSLMKR